MHGLCQSAVRKPSASGSFSHPPQIALQRMNASAHPRAFWCENEVRWSVLLLGASENGRTIDRQKQLVLLKSCAKSGRHGSGRFAALCPPPPAAPEVSPLLKFPSSSLKSFQQSYLETDDTTEYLRGFSRLPVYPQKTSWEVLSCPLRKLWVWCCEKVRERPMKKGDKQGWVFLREETHTTVDRLTGNLFHLSVPFCFPLSLFILVICSSGEAADDRVWVFFRSL